MSEQNNDLAIEQKRLKAEIKALILENKQLKQERQILQNELDQKIAQDIKQAMQPLLKQASQLPTQTKLKDINFLLLNAQLNKNK
ncbi:MAG: hypothetical protein LBH62_09085 [Nitrososphaerota archaeon]|jgi:regulator of replication initiation timing|uniref:hypothetical protein n=1 Tax=Candidatus Bathycorpusculum sp. TaxID=2994959 RepID=UPI0028246423|nr:hypothetical protein [Candidatus Termiticorpusculum sp.]MCL2258159.1 hypothetical protein [Candidatus Termiticorpusculum sp.]MCL2291535.1 hypothetical protein [Candidatus Termiticorpusculum sp.]MDR0461555.1 hypothetical protein [Nitrososphaerota archaeon]